MVEVLLILDGASEPSGRSLTDAAMPHLTELSRSGEVTRLRTVPSGLEPGSETAIPTLLGHTPDAPVDRAAIEAAAYGIEGEGFWRIDVRSDDGARADDASTARAAGRLRVAGHVIHHLRGHRPLVVHVGGADEAAHRRDRAAKVTFLERVDAELIGPLADAVAAACGTLRICPDHGCDPATGRHDAEPVPHVAWTAVVA